MPQDIIDALDRDGQLTTDQVHRMISVEASWLGLNYVEAEAYAAYGLLPHTALGSDVDLLFRMLD